MSIAKHDQQELDQLFSNYKDQFGGRKEDYFALLYLKKKFKCDPTPIAHQVAFGGNDYGLDAYYIDRDARNLYLYQFKWSENHNLFKESLDRLSRDGLDRIFGNPLQDPSQNEYIRYLKADIREHKALIERIYIHFVFKGDLDSADKSCGLSNLMETLRDKKHLVETFFGNQPIALIPEFVSDRRAPASSPPLDTHTISFAEKASIELAEGGKTLHLGFISLMDLHRIHKSLGQRFFDRNIRAGLSPENPPNRKIREALATTVLRKEQPPEVFAFNHNGITLAAADVQFADGHATLKVPRLLNGAQTATSLEKFLEDNESHPALKANRQVLEAIRVLAKIVVTGDREFITQVTICNNQQNPVNPWNLRANDQIQCDLQDRLLEEVKIFYSRQENAFQALSDSDRLDLGIEDSRDMKIRPLAQTFLAVQGEIDKISRLRDLFENTKQYEETFRASYLHCDARKIVLAYKVQIMLNSVMQRIDERVARKMAYALTKARNLVWSLLIQGLLNDPDLPDLLENYGRSLGKEIDFREHLKNTASSKILPILRDVLDSKHYKQKLEEEKYSFLSTKEIFRTSMDLAYKKHRWLKKSL